MGACLSSKVSSSSTTPLNYRSECDDCLGDPCSICLEGFTVADSPCITKCKHVYHLPCILQWAKRRVNCPVCLQYLVFQDPASQELLARVESKATKSNTAAQGNGIHIRVGVRIRNQTLIQVSFSHFSSQNVTQVNITPGSSHQRERQQRLREKEQRLQQRLREKEQRLQQRMRERQQRG